MGNYQKHNPDQVQRYQQADHGRYRRFRNIHRKHLEYRIYDKCNWKALQKVAATLPMTYISNDFADFWTGGSYNFMPFIQSFIFFGAVTGILLMYARYTRQYFSESSDQKIRISA